MGIKFVAKVKALQRDLEAYDKKRIKAYQTAVKVGGFGLFKTFKEEVAAGRPGGKNLSPLSQIAKRTKTGRRRKKARKPLSSLAPMVRYKATTNNGQLNVDVGFISPKINTRSWKQLVNLHQEGGAVDTLYSGSRTELGRRLAGIGGRLKKAGDPDSKFFFLRKHAGRSLGSVAGMMIPSRPEIEPLWDAHKKDAEKNIVLNFHRKMQGERI
jgi:hypothetical protein